LLSVSSRRNDDTRIERWQQQLDRQRAPTGLCDAIAGGALSADRPLLRVAFAGTPFRVDADAPRTASR